MLLSKFEPKSLKIARTIWECSWGCTAGGSWKCGRSENVRRMREVHKPKAKPGKSKDHFEEEEGDILLSF